MRRRSFLLGVIGGGLLQLVFFAQARADVMAISIGSVAADRGTSVLVPVSLSLNTDQWTSSIGQFSLVFQYDTGALTLNSVTLAKIGGSVPGGVVPTDWNAPTVQYSYPAAGYVKIQAFAGGINEITSTGSILGLTFGVAPGASGFKNINFGYVTDPANTSITDLGTEYTPAGTSSAPGVFVNGGIAINDVPEPSSLVLISCCALAGLFYYRRRASRVC